VLDHDQHFSLATHSSFEDSSFELVDDISASGPSTQVGYSLFSEPANGFRRHQMKLFDAVMSSHRARAYFGEDVDDDFVWNLRRLKKWFSNVLHLLKLIFSIMHLTYAQPARGEELSESLLCNTRSSARNFYWKYGTIMLVTHYHKSRSITNSDKYVARFFPRCLSELFIQYVVLVPFLYESMNSLRGSSSNYVLLTPKAHSALVRFCSLLPRSAPCNWRWFGRKHPHNKRSLNPYLRWPSLCFSPRLPSSPQPSFFIYSLTSYFCPPRMSDFRAGF
jgi:hypothetical protein